MTKRSNELSEKEFELIKRHAKNTPFFKRLTKRDYRKRDGYRSYKEIILDLALNWLSKECDYEIRGYTDVAWIEVLHSSSMAYNNPTFPVFALTKELAQAFNDSDLPPVVGNIQRSFHNALILLPKLIFSPDGYPVQWVFVTHLKEGEIIKPYPVGNRVNESLTINAQKVRWVTFVSNGVVSKFAYSSTVEFDETKKELIQGNINFGYVKNKKNEIIERNFLREVDSLVLQTILYLQIQKELETKPPKNIKGVGFSTNNSSNTLLEPIWIGKDYKRKEEISIQSPKNSTGTHTSPRYHTRRGHWKHQPCGEKRLERKLIWIEPTDVNLHLKETLLD